MRLRTISPPLSDVLIEALESCNIRTDADLLFSAIPMEIYQKIAPTSVPLAELIAEVARVASIAAAPVSCADDMIERETTRRAARSTQGHSSGIPELDSLVAGFDGPKLIEVSGDRGSCKTSLALQIVMRNLSSRPDHSALWVDTTGDFSIDRVVPILQSCHHLPGVDTAAARLQLALAFDLDTLYEVLRPLESSYQSEPMTLLVIDNVTPLFRPMMSAVSAKGHATMAAFMRHLRALADTYALSILLINGTSVATAGGLHSLVPEKSRKPALGPSFTYMTDVTLWLSKTVPDRRAMADAPVTTPSYEAEVLRSRISPSNIRCSFEMHDGVLRATGPEEIGRETVEVDVDVDRT